MIIPMKYTARFLNGTAFKPSDWGENGKPIVRIAQLTGKEFDNYYDGNIESRYHIDTGDLLFSWSATLDSFEWKRGPALLNQHIFKVSPLKGTNKRFLYYSLKHYSKVWADLDAHGSTMRHIKKESLGNKIWLPEPTIQRGIADFLDHETARIDELIEKKQRFADLTGGKISKFIDQAVTLGLNFTAPKKQTNIPWLPEIPDHWEIRQAKYLYREANRVPLSEDEVITAFRDGQVTLRSKRRMDGFTFAILEVGYQHIKKGDLVIHTMDAFAGAIGVSEDDGKATGEYAVCDAINPTTTNNMYFAHLLRCMARRDYIFVMCPSVRERAPRFRFVRFASTYLPCPSAEEQNTIVRVIDEQTTKLRVLRDRTVASIERLREFRSALITAAVTGQIDFVRWDKEAQTDRRLDQIQEAMPA